MSSHEKLLHGGSFPVFSYTLLAEDADAPRSGLTLSGFRPWRDPPGPLHIQERRAGWELQSAAKPVTAGEVWRELMEGRARVAGHGTTQSHCYLTLVSPLGKDRPAALSPSHVRLLESAATGESQKALAMARGRSNSAISTVLKECLRGLGLSCQFRQFPLPLALFAHHRCCAARSELHALRFVTSGQQSVIALRRPDGRLRPSLTPAEYEVMRHVVEGKAHREIASLRGVSPRTIANQLRGLFHKLGVCGRFQLIGRALAHQERPLIEV